MTGTVSASTEKFLEAAGTKAEPCYLANGKDALTVVLEKDSSLMEIIESKGYTLKDDDLDLFLGEFMLLNEDVKSIGMIPKGSSVKLPLKYLKKSEDKT